MKFVGTANPDIWAAAIPVGVLRCVTTGAVDWIKVGTYYEVREYNGLYFSFDGIQVCGAWLKDRFESPSVAQVVDHKKAAPELPPECWRDRYGLNRRGVDFMAAVRQIAESTKK